MNIKRNEIEIKQHKEVNRRKHSTLSGPLRLLLCNALIQPHFDDASQAWYPNLPRTFLIKFQRAQNKCIRFCLNLDNRAHLDKKEFKYINWLPVKERVHQRTLVTAFNFLTALPQLTCQTFSSLMTRCEPPEIQNIDIKFP